MKLAVFLGLIAAVCLYLITLYNALINLKHQLTQSWANIDVILKQRHDELPKLVEVCRQYAQFEQETLTQVMAARGAVADSARARDPEALGTAESRLHGLIGQLYAVAEAYPALQADQQFAQLSARISQLEEALADRRELYNEAVKLHNARIEQFPDVLLARLFHFPPARPLRFAAAETRDVDVKALFARN
ncbi:LemA family protein [Chromobacterium haemolyticum]|uniref:LemA family protein n=1 Tax=Chromobacterium fluminis TaxID=3044269 RepID=A0ABX0L1U0_9NEIS|nr:LemA family protein [Chromobacterium haemolyticum]NHR04775.1 LemA family protein [Chromobacterium haemolyticum]